MYLLITVVQYLSTQIFQFHLTVGVYYLNIPLFKLGLKQKKIDGKSWKYFDLDLAQPCDCLFKLIFVKMFKSETVLFFGMLFFLQDTAHVKAISLISQHLALFYPFYYTFPTQGYFFMRTSQSGKSSFDHHL